MTWLELERPAWYVVTFVDPAFGLRRILLWDASPCPQHRALFGMNRFHDLSEVVLLVLRDRMLKTNHAEYEQRCSRR